jgi:uncharacterized membrane protein YoaT (DUF817 family)
MVDYSEFATWTLLVVVLLGVQIQIVKVKQRIEKLEGGKK